MTNKLTQPNVDLSLLAIRVMTAIVFLFHGSQKLFGAFGGHGIEGTAGWMESIDIPFPTLSATLAGGTEFVGGIALLTGVLMRTMSLPLAFAMLVGAFTAHSGFDVTQGGMEYPLVLAVVVLALGVSGPGRFSVGAGRFDLVPARALQGAAA